MKLLIIGATSAIAHETAKFFARAGAELFLVGRSPEKLAAVRDDLKVRGAKRVEALAVDLADFSKHQFLIDTAIQTLGELDAILVAHGTLPDQEKTQYDLEKSLAEFNLNCTSYISLLTISANYFEKRKRGCIAAITSVAGDRGRQTIYIYGAAKGAVSIFMQGLRNRLAKSGVTVLTIKPGLVATPMTAGLKRGLLMADPQKVGKDIYIAMQERKDILYTPWFWRYIMLIITNIPEFIFKRLKI